MTEVKEFYDILKKYKGKYFVTLDLILNPECKIIRNKYKKIFLNNYVLFCQSRLGLMEEMQISIQNYLILVRSRKERGTVTKDEKYCLCLLALLKYGDNSKKQLLEIFDAAVVDQVIKDLKTDFLEYCFVDTCNFCLLSDSDKCQKIVNKRVLNAVINAI